jgi:hypothetical protein
VRVGDVAEPEGDRDGVELVVAEGQCERVGEDEPLEKSAATTRAPDRASAPLEVPVPAARSRIRSPARGRTARTVARRQREALPPDSRVFVRSYRRET